MDYAWLAPALCALAFFVNVLIWRQFGRAKHWLSAATSIVAVIAALGVALYVFADALTAFGDEHGVAEAIRGATLLPRYLIADKTPWFTVGNYPFHATLVVDWLSIMMVGVVSLLTTLIEVYSLGYLKGDGRFWWFFSVMSLFGASMLLLVLSANFLLIYMAWELVGLCSFLLIGFWYQERDNAEAAKKAFITNRIGDVGFFIGLAILFLQTGTFQMEEIFGAIASGRIDPTIVTVAGILVFTGAMGKSGQFPLHVWLPDAMAGPTPVSALLHSATMVAAGVYLVGRAYPLFSASPVTMAFIAAVGTITLIFAATIALTQPDVKRVLAYSTVSQLGYMMMALGVGAYTAGLFHLFTHAFFKALLFLCAGSMIHAMEAVYGHHDKRANDIFMMGGLRKRMPVTFWTFVIASLSLSGIFPLSGFWSKDAILGGALEAGAWLPFLLGLITAFLTAFYMFRAIFVAFFGEERWRLVEATGAHPVHPEEISPQVHAGQHTVEEDHSVAHGVDHSAHEPGEPHESPWVMLLPLVILVVPAAIAGWIGIPDLFNPFAEAVHFGTEHEEHVNYLVAGLGLLAGLLGIGLAWVIYVKRIVRAEAIAGAFPAAYNTLYNKYYFDEAYQWIINRIVLGIAGLSATFDRKVINEGVVDTPASLTSAAGARIRLLETGRVYVYAFAFVVGIVFVGIVMAWTNTYGVPRFSIW